jgi:two-component system sensor histidine kinase SenX3
MRFRRESATPTGDRDLPELLLKVLEQLEGAAVVLSPGEVPVFSTSQIEQIGIIKDGRIASEELLAIVRVVRRTNQKQSGKIEIARGPIGEGKHELMVNVLPLTEGKLVLVTLRDESEADRVHEVRRDFVANISHELKTPISALRTLSEAVSVATEDPQLNKFASMMQSQVERLSTLVQEIIDLSRLQDADPLLDALHVDIDEAVDEAIDQCQFLAGTREITINRGPRINAEVIGDRTHLIMAFHNLIENAINYSPDKTRVNVNTTAINQIAEISVIDQGVGISDADQIRIFERFYRVDPARSRVTGGTGLGLSIVKHVIGNHGGEVSVWSSSGVGSTFTIRLPITDDGIEEGQS